MDRYNLKMIIKPSLQLFTFIIHYSIFKIIHLLFHYSLFIHFSKAKKILKKIKTLKF